MANLPNVLFKEAVDSVNEAEGYEEFRVERRRGLWMFVMAGLMGMVVVMSLQSRTSHPVSVNLLLLLSAGTMALMLLFTFLRMRSTTWNRVFEANAPGKGTFWNFPKDWLSRIALLLFFAWNFVLRKMFRSHPLIDDLCFSALLALMVVAAGRRAKDKWFYVLAAVPLLVAIGLVTGFVPAELNLVVMGLGLGILLLAMSLVRLFAPRRWLIR